MKISEMVEKLVEMKNEYGDIEVCAREYHGYFCNANEIFYSPPETIPVNLMCKTVVPFEYIGIEAKSIYD